MVLAYHMLHHHHKYISETLSLPHSERVSTLAMVELYYEREREQKQKAEQERKQKEAMKKHDRMARRRS